MEFGEFGVPLCVCVSRGGGTSPGLTGMIELGRASKVG